MDYNTLIASQATAGSIGNFISDSLVVASASQIIQEAESFIYRRLRHWKMLTSATGSLVIGTPTLALPADLLEPSYLTITGVNKQTIDQKTKEEVIDSWGVDGSGNRVNQQPLIYFFDQSNIQFDNPPDQTYPYLLYYFQQPAALSAGNTTNFLTSTYPRMLRCALMMGACEFKKDVGQGEFDRTYWEQQAMGEIQTAQAESDRAVRAITGAAQIL